MMSTVVLETCRGINKRIKIKNFCIKLVKNVIIKQSTAITGMTEVLKFYCAVTLSSALWACINLFYKTLRKHLSAETCSSLILVTNCILWCTFVA